MMEHGVSPCHTYATYFSEQLGFSSTASSLSSRAHTPQPRRSSRSQAPLDRAQAERAWRVGLTFLPPQAMQARAVR